jgi:type VII secretion-associated serine protease mycosin
MRARRLLALAAAASVAATGLTVAAPTAAQAQECNPRIAQLVKDTPPALQRLNARYAWGVATGRGVVVAVVDSGVDRHNKHLRDALVPGRSFVPGVAADGDEAGHGTAIAGEIAARQIPGSGVVGLAPDARIMPVRVFFGADDQSRAAGVGPRPDRMAEGIRWAADHGAQVINVSMSTPTNDARLRAAVQHATDRGALVVASAGNRTTAEDKSDGVRYPGGYPEAVAVSAADLGDTVTDDSIHGPHVDLSAPGTDILTAYYGAGDCLISAEGESTSFATAYVSASAALLAQQFPHAAPADWKHRLEVTASRERRDGRDDRAGWGLVQPYEALTAVMDDSLAGPVAPGSSPHAVAAPQARPLDLRKVSDPLAPQRTAALWWCLGGVSALLALVLGGMLARPRRRGPAGRRRAVAASQQP